MPNLYLLVSAASRIRRIPSCHVILAKPVLEVALSSRSTASGSPWINELDFGFGVFRLGPAGVCRACSVGDRKHVMYRENPRIMCTRPLVPNPRQLIPLTMSQTNSSEVLMTPYLHFIGGDHLYFRSWRPSSHGAIAGASITLLIFALLERLLHATRGAMDARWRRRYELHDYFD